MSLATTSSSSVAAIPPRFRRIWRITCITIAAAIVLYGAERVLPRGVQPGIVVYSAVIGGLSGLLAIGLVLVYQANRIINFAQAAVGSVGLILSFELNYNKGWPYVPAVIVGVAASALLAGIAEVTVIRRFAKAPRLIVTLSTIGLANVFLFLQLVIVVLLEYHANRTSAGVSQYPSPFVGGKAFFLDPIVFSGDAIVAIVVVPVLLVGLIWFFRRSRFGVAMRAAAENSDRASLLGIPVARLSTLFWVLSGALAAFGTILRAPITGYSFTDLSGTGFLAVTLTAAVVGRLQNLLVTFLAAIGIELLDQLYFANYSASAPLAGIHLAIVVIALLFMRDRARATWAEVSSWKAFREVRPIPAELARFVEVRIGRALLPLLGVGAVLAVPLLVQNLAPLRLASVMAVWGIAAVSLVILTGWAGQISLGQWALVGVGAFTAGRLLSLPDQPNLVVTLGASAVAGGVIAAALGLPALRLRGIYLAVITFGFAEAAHSWLFNLDFVRPTGDLPRPPLIGDERRAYYLVAIMLLLCILVAVNIRRSRLGRALIAARDNAQAAQSFGVNLLRARLAAFVVSGAMAGLAGGLFALVTQAVTYQDFDTSRSLQVFAIAVIGGLGSIPGALIGTVYIVGSAQYLPGYGTFLATGAGMLFFLVIFPGGLGQLVYGARDALLRQVAIRRGVVSASLLADIGDSTAQAPVSTAADRDPNKSPADPGAVSSLPSLPAGDLR